MGREKGWGRQRATTTPTNFFLFSFFPASAFLFIFYFLVLFYFIFYFLFCPYCILFYPYFYFYLLSRLSFVFASSVFFVFPVFRLSNLFFAILEWKRTARKRSARSEREREEGGGMEGGRKAHAV